MSAPETPETVEIPVAKRNLESALSFAATNYIRENGPHSKPTRIQPVTSPTSSTTSVEDRLLDFLSYCGTQAEYIEDIVQIAKHYIRRANRGGAVQYGGSFKNPIALLIDQLKQVNTAPSASLRHDLTVTVTAAKPPSPPRKESRSALTRLFPSKTRNQHFPVPRSRRKLKTNLQLFALALEFLTPPDLIRLGLVSKAVYLFLTAQGEEPNLAKKIWSSVLKAIGKRRLSSLQSREEYLRSQRNRARCMLVCGAKNDRNLCTRDVYAAAQECGCTVFELGAGGMNKFMAMPREATHDWVLPLFSAAKASSPAIIYLPQTDDLVRLFNCEQLGEGAGEKSLYAETMLYSLIDAVCNDFCGEEHSSFVSLVAFTHSTHPDNHTWQLAFSTHLPLPETTVNNDQERLATPTSKVREYLLQRLESIDHELSKDSIERIIQARGITSRESVDNLLSSAAKQFTARLHEATHFRKNTKQNKYEICAPTDNGAEARLYTSLRLSQTRFGPLRRKDFLPFAT